MWGEDTGYSPLQWGQPQCEESSNDWDEWEEWEEFEPGPVEENLWDAFESDDEMVEPQPEYGDFWGELDEEEII